MKKPFISTISILLMSLGLLLGAGVQAQTQTQAGPASQAEPQVEPQGAPTSTAEDMKATAGDMKERAGQVLSDTRAKAEELGQQAQEKAEQFSQQAQQKVDELATTLDQSEQAKEISAGLLQPIYQVAEWMSFSAFYWLAFAFMLAGVIGYGLQLVLGKLVVLSKSGFSLSEIISDAIGFIISLVGLVLTTQAAAQNSAFTQSPATVLSSAVLGVVIGIILYIWGQSHEVQAAQGRKDD